MNKFLPKEVYEEEGVLFIDVRTPEEYSIDSITGAINIPLFTNEERKEIGTVYKQVSKREAIGLGYKYGGARLRDYFKFVQEMESKYHKIVFMCARGGGRSAFVVANLSLAFGNIYQLENGYKGYRSYLLSNLDSEILKHEYIVLTGKTGVGKTKFLKFLTAEGYPVIDLEGYANNRGSLFGDLGLESHSRKRFDSLLFHALKTCKSPHIFIEGESKKIGNVVLPNQLVDKMVTGTHLFLNTSMGPRVRNILKDYGLDRGIIDKQEKEIIINKLHYLKKRLGAQKVNELIQYIQEDKYQYVVEYLINEYYDPLYQYSEDQYNNVIQVQFETCEEGLKLIKREYERAKTKET